jgi:electron transfer flavoprotein beta subunit
MTVIETANEPRPPAAKRVLRYKRARVLDELAGEVKQALPEATDSQREEEVSRRAATVTAQGLLVEQWNLDRINADLSRCGLAGSPTKVHRVQSIVLTKQGYTGIPATEEGVRQLIHELVVDRTLG